MTRLTLTLDSDDIERILRLLDRIEDVNAARRDGWGQRELAVADLVGLLRDAIMER